jgi:hypothetical protein
MCNGDDPAGVVHHLTADLDHALEVGGVGDGDLDEDDVAGVGEVVVVDDLLELLGVLATVARVRFVGDQADGATGAVPQEPFGCLVEDDVDGAQLEGALQPRQDLQDDDGGDEEAADLHTVRTFADVVDGGVDEDQRDEGEGSHQSALTGPSCGQRDGGAGAVPASTHRAAPTPPDRRGPFGRHAVAGQVARDQGR